jgi:hypothetical protein
MKYILLLALGIALGVYADRYWLTDRSGVARDLAPPDRGAFDEKLRQWHLTPDDIRQDLSKTGEVVRTQAGAVGGKISDARILTVIKAKYVLDRDLSVCDIHVSVENGRVILAGTVTSEDLLGRAVALALDTGGVADVHSRLALKG